MRTERGARFTENSLSSPCDLYGRLTLGGSGTTADIADLLLLMNG